MLTSGTSNNRGACEEEDAAWLDLGDSRGSDDPCDPVTLNTLVNWVTPPGVSYRHLRLSFSASFLSRGGIPFGNQLAICAVHINGAALTEESSDTARE